MKSIKEYLEFFVIRNKNRLKTRDEWHIQFEEIFNNTFSDEEISRALIAAAPKNIDIGDGTCFAIVYMTPWKEIHMIRIGCTTKTTER